jgi:hypothetical protein
MRNGAAVGDRHRSQVLVTGESGLSQRPGGRVAPAPGVPQAASVYRACSTDKDSLIARQTGAGRVGRDVGIRSEGGLDGLGRADNQAFHAEAGVYATAWAKFSGPMISGASGSASVSGILTTVRRVTGERLPVTCVPVRPGEMTAVIVGISPARQTGYEPEQNLTPGLAMTGPAFSEAAQ